MEQIAAIYRAAKSIYNKEECLVMAKEKIYLNHGINKNSFAMYYRAFQKMMDGELHTRGINSDLSDFYLHHIYVDYGPKRLEKSLSSYKKFIEYYEGCHENVVMKKEREIYNRHNELLNNQNLIR